LSAEKWFAITSECLFCRVPSGLPVGFE